MPLTVGELVEIPHLGIRVLVPGDLSRPIRWVHASEQLDPTPYLRGGELLLTDGMWLEGSDVADAYVARVRAVDIAAIGYGPMPETPSVPDTLVDACVQHDMCLFAMPPTLPYIAVSEVFFGRFAEDRASVLSANLARNLRLLDAVASGGGAASIVELLESESGLSVWITGAHGQVTTHGGHLPSALDVATVRSILALGIGRLPATAGGWRVEPILAVGVPRGFLVVADEPPVSIEQRAVLDQALPFLGMELAHLRAMSESQRLVAAELVELVLAGDEQAGQVAARLRASGIDPDRPIAVAVCQGDDLELVLDGTETALDEAGFRYLAAVRGDQVVAFFVWTGHDADPAEMAELLHRRIDVPAAVGVGSLAMRSAALRSSLIEARHACLLAGSRRGSSGHGTYADVGSYQVLLDLVDTEVLRTFSSALLGPIMEHDQRKQTDLLETLNRFLESGGNWQSTAAALHVHVNTLRYRLRRIESLTGRSLQETAARVDFFLAIRATREL
jgi:PucR family transcriptional regulator, purine catabolism regulatory protein